VSKYKYYSIKEKKSIKIFYWIANKYLINDAERPFLYRISRNRPEAEGDTEIYNILIILI